MLIGARTLRLRTGSDQADISVQVFAPERAADGGWFCRYSIGWPHAEHESEGWGHDALQAILLTLTKIGTEIYASPYHDSGGLAWGEEGRGYGFPVPGNLRGVLVGDDARFL